MGDSSFAKQWKFDSGAGFSLNIVTIIVAVFLFILILRTLRCVINVLLSLVIPFAVVAVVLSLFPNSSELLTQSINGATYLMNRILCAVDSIFW